MAIQTSELVISLDRRVCADDERAVLRLMSQWLVYDVKIQKKWSSAEIHLYHTEGARPQLVNLVEEMFPNKRTILH